MKLSPNFSLRELTKSQNAVRAGGKVLKAQQNPGPEVTEKLRYLCTVALQPARTYLGAGMFIGSGWRCPELNAITPGSSETSQHSKAEAADMDMAEAFLTNPSPESKQVKRALDSIIHAVTGKPVRRDVNANFYLFAFYVLYLHYCDVDQVIHEYGENGKPDWIHVSASEGKNRREILVVRRNSKGKPVYTRLNTKQALMLGC